jgi:hypothetical protein
VAFGKKFKKGICKDPNRKETFGYILGACGSAYAASISDAIRAILEHLESTFQVSLSSYMFDFELGGDVRISPPEIYNFSRYLDESPLKTDKHLTLVDAGVATNLPFQPLFRRNVNLYIVCDATGESTAAIGNELFEVESYARKNGLPFPKIDYKKLVSKKVSVWSDPKDPSVPVIVHLPNFNDFLTLKFDYSEEEFDLLMGGIESAVIENRDLFIEALQLAAENVLK